MDVHLRGLAARQSDVVAAWQLLAVGWSRGMIDHRVERERWRRVHRGVYALTQAPLSRRQRWIAATLTAPDCVLSHASGGACWGFRAFHARFETVTRPGNGGRRRFDGVLVCRSRTLDGDTTDHDGIRITTGARTVIDLAAELSERETRRAFRECVRLKATRMPELQSTLSRHPGRRGTTLLADLASRYETLRPERLLALHGR